MGKSIHIMLHYVLNAKELNYVHRYLTHKQ